MGPRNFIEKSLKTRKIKPSGLIRLRVRIFEKNVVFLLSEQTTETLFRVKMESRNFIEKSRKIRKIKPLVLIDNRGRYNLWR